MANIVPKMFAQYIKILQKTYAIRQNSNSKLDKKIYTYKNIKNIYSIITFNGEHIKTIWCNDILYFKGKDIANILKYKNSTDAILNHVDKQYKSRLKNIFTKDQLNNIPSNELITIYLTGDGVKMLCLKSKMSSTIIKNICKSVLNIDLNLLNDKVITKEQNNLDKILRAFKDLKYKTQLQCGTYRIDLYFTDYKIAIECDEFGHVDRDPIYEEIREKFIENNLKCTFVRFDPDNQNFDIFDVINEIHNVILKNVKSQLFLNNIITPDIKYINKLHSSLEYEKLKYNKFLSHIESMRNVILC